MLQSRRGLVVYQLVLILLAAAILIWLIFMFAVLQEREPAALPVDSAVVDTAPFPVPTTPGDATDTTDADTVPQ